jgi:hypothetical protein
VPAPQARFRIPEHQPMATPMTTTLSRFDVNALDTRGSERRTMAAILGVAETDCTLTELQECGFDPCTVSLLELLPVVELAWADGEISARDRRILEGAAARRSAIRGRACTQLSLWLSRRPPDAMFRLGRRALRELLHQSTHHDVEGLRSALLADCALVMPGTGGLLREEQAPSSEQQALLSELIQELTLPRAADHIHES